MEARRASPATTLQRLPAREWQSIPSYKLAGPKGIVRKLVQDADLALANHEQPTPTNWSFHKQGTHFSGKPDLTQIFVNGGIDWMSLANNHIRDYGATGVMNTLKTLDKYGIKHAGAGANLKQAAKPSYSRSRARPWPSSRVSRSPSRPSRRRRLRPGALPCKSKATFAAIQAARKKADILIVFPHWGIEFSRSRRPIRRSSPSAGRTWAWTSSLARTHTSRVASATSTACRSSTPWATSSSTRTGRPRPPKASWSR